MDPWQAVLLSIVGNTVVVGVLSYFGQALIQRYMDGSLEKAKLELQKLGLEHEVRFRRADEKTALVIAEVYGLLVRYHRAVGALASPIDIGDTDKGAKAQRAEDQRAAFWNVFIPGEIHLPEDLAQKVNEVHEKLLRIQIGMERVTKHPAEHTAEHWDKTYQSYKDTAEPLFDALRREFRTLLYKPSPTK